MKSIIDYKALQIRIAPTETILDWSHGEVKEPETINYRSLKPEKDGLFDEKIFGPVKDFECHCGKYKRIRYKGIVCDKCGVEVTHSRVRRERMGHIDLACPVAHIWYFKGAPSKLSLLLSLSPRNINSIVYFSKYIVLEVDKDRKKNVLERLEIDLENAITDLKEDAEKNIIKIKKDLDKDKEELVDKIENDETLQLKRTELETKAKNEIIAVKQNLEVEIEQTEEIYKTIKKMVKKIKKKSILTEDEYLKLDDYRAASHLKVGMGAESLLELSRQLDLDKMAEKLRTDMLEAKGAKRRKATKRLKVVEGLKKSKVKASWLYLKALPVIPPELRPMVQLSGGRFASSDLNDLYRRVINRNNRLKHLMSLGAPDIILRNEKRMLQEAVDSLIDSPSRSRRRRSSRRPLKSLSEMLKGKQGRFRRNLLGKRVDYSGRSVIVVGPELKLNECGLPKNMALEMFKPYVLHELIKLGVAPNIKNAKNLVDRMEPEVYDVLEKVTENHPVLLNRAPTLHKLGIQAFYPILTEGSAIRLHPCVCSGYNADFDGDQMAVHVPLTKKAQEEAIELMLAQNNLLKPANGEPITVPNKTMALGVFYNTSIDQSIEESDKVYASVDEAIHAYQVKRIKLRQLIKVRIQDNDGYKILNTTVGRLQLNNILPKEIKYINEEVNAGKLKEIVTKVINNYDSDVVAELTDDIKDLGFRAATDSGLSVSVTDCKMIEEKDDIIDDANRDAGKIKESYQQGFITDDERRRKIFDIWMETTETVANKTWNSYAEDNAVKIMINSGGTRASKDQVKQLAAMRGLVVDPLGNIVEMPTKSNFRQGLSIFEYVTSARGSRKGLTDSALKTADAGYLTRRLVDVSHDVIIRTEDCGTKRGITISKDQRRDSFKKRIIGRLTIEPVKLDKKVIVDADEMITDKLATQIDQSDKIQSVKVRSPLTCEAHKGLCAHCYGWDLSTKKMVKVGVPVGVVAAQSIGEPGTQLTMRVKHSGGIVGLDVTQGLPRVEELLETRNPKSKAEIAHSSGKVEIKESKNERTIIITADNPPHEDEIHNVPVVGKLLVEDGDKVSIGQQLTAGSIDSEELLEVKGLLVSQLQIVSDVQAVYESQGIVINDRHFEVVVRKMGNKVQIEVPGDTEFLTGEVVERSRFIEGNDATMAEGGEPATAKVMLLGITRSALYTSSWLSAASFQHTKRVLTDAAISGSIDYLEGLKENVVIGRLIPTTEERARIA